MRPGGVISELSPVVTLLQCPCVIVPNCEASSQDPVSHPANFLQSLSSLRTRDHQLPLPAAPIPPMSLRLLCRLLPESTFQRCLIISPLSRDAQEIMQRTAIIF